MKSNLNSLLKVCLNCFQPGAIIGALLFFVVQGFSQVTLTTLVTFDGTNGWEPQQGLTEGNDGNFYGVLSYGGLYDAGTAFRMSPDGKCVILVRFDGNNGLHPASLIQGKDGNFYGTALEGGPGGNGTIFKMTLDGTISTLAAFDGDNGFGPWGLVQDKEGNLFGKMSTLKARGQSEFEVTLNGRLIIPPTNAVPVGSSRLVKDTSGNSYGTTFAGDISNRPRFVWGTVFKVGGDGTRTTLIAFNETNGANPLPDLVQGRDGNIYGITTKGGAFKQGTIFRLNLTDASNTKRAEQAKINVPLVINAVSNKIDPRIMDLMQAQ
jgi:uncharacterized repeat protein (TIGR03803 family)